MSSPPARLAHKAPENAMPIRTIADIEALEQSPVPISGIRNTYELIARTAAQHPDHHALSFFVRVEDHAQPVRFSYREWLAQITRTANFFRRLGVKREDVITYALPNLPETHSVHWGGETAGIAFAVNPILEGRQIGELLRAAGSQWLVVTTPTPDPGIWQRAEAAIPHCPTLKGVIAIDPVRHLPGDRPATVVPAMLAGLPVFDFHAEVAREHGDALDFASPEPDAIASYLCTGGTTGLPKIACHTHRNEIWNAIQLGSVANFIAVGETVLTALPLFHVNAQIGTGLTSFAHGAHVLLATPGGYRTPGLIARFWEIIAHHRVRSFSAVPTVYAGLLQTPRAGHDLSCLTHAICGAAPMPVELFHRFEKETGIHILEGYGLTEGTCVSSLNPAQGECRIGSIGLRLPWQCMRAMITDGELREAAIDEAGTLFISGPNVFPGYLDPAHNQGAWLETAETDGSTRRWFNTGDLGRRDAEDYFWLAGRKKELIIRGGHNIDPKSIEEALATHPAVALCAAVGRPDAYAGEVPVVYVQLRPGQQTTEEALLAHAASHISEGAAVPKAVMFLSEFPVTAVGKLFKPALLMREIENVIRTEARQEGVVLSSLKVVQDPKRGLLARYAVGNGDSSALVKALGRYTFATEDISE
jgi:acyl-CoA synthetase (AMP-forming)/AMP-acid ligase II